MQTTSYVVVVVLLLEYYAVEYITLSRTMHSTS